MNKQRILELRASLAAAEDIGSLTGERVEGWNVVPIACGDR